MDSAQHSLRLEEMPVEDLVVILEVYREHWGQPVLAAGVSSVNLVLLHQMKLVVMVVVDKLVAVLLGIQYPAAAVAAAARLAAAAAAAVRPVL